VFAAEPDTVPFYALPNKGINTIQQTATPSGGVSWDYAFLGTAGKFLNHADKKSLGLMFNQQNIETWNTDSILDPDRLQLMRCAYQRALGYQCPDPSCNGLLIEFFKPEPQLLAPMLNPGWVHVGTWKDVPVHAAHVGHYGKVCAWVMPEDMNSLALFALAMLDISTASLHPQTQDPTAGRAAQIKALADQIKVLTDVYKALPEPVGTQQKADQLLLQMRIYGELERLANLYSNQPDRDRFAANIQQLVAHATKTFGATNAPDAEKNLFQKRVERLQADLIGSFDSSVMPAAPSFRLRREFNTFPGIQNVAPQP
jgi:hypothetical protein